MELTKASETWSNRERHLLGEVRNLTEKLEESFVRLRQLEWNLEDAVKEKSNITEKYGHQMSVEVINMETLRIGIFYEYLKFPDES